MGQLTAGAALLAPSHRPCRLRGALLRGLREEQPCRPTRPPTLSPLLPPPLPADLRLSAVRKARLPWYQRLTRVTRTAAYSEATWWAGAL